MKCTYAQSSILSGFDDKPFKLAIPDCYLERDSTCSTRNMVKAKCSSDEFKQLNSSKFVCHNNNGMVFDMVTTEVPSEGCQFVGDFMHSGADNVTGCLTENEEKALADLQQHFPNSNFKQMVDLIQQNALYIFTHDWSKLSQIKLHLKGTEFQLKVWETLLKIPMGKLSTYGSIAEKIQSPNASRAVGTAIGSNPVAFLIPCHRVIQSSGAFGGYMWGATRKTAIIGWEAAQTQL